MSKQGNPPQAPDAALGAGSPASADGRAQPPAPASSPPVSDFPQQAAPASSPAVGDFLQQVARPPAHASSSQARPPAAAKSRAVSDFLQQAAKMPQRAGGEGRLVFAMDATASREPSWDRACQLHAELFSATAASGPLSVQLCYYRGFREFHASPWCASPAQLLGEMCAVRCRGGQTQIGRLLEHLQAEHRRQPVQAAVLVGDAMEENADTLCHLAGQLGVMNLPLFIFQEGRQPQVERVFREMTRLSGGAWAPFDLSSAAQLKTLLGAVAVYATGGAPALRQLSGSSGSSGSALARLTQQLRHD